jgi:hypothetical protein
MSASVVLWGMQSEARPTTSAFISLEWSSTSIVGQDSVVREVDAADDAMDQYVGGLREGLLTIRCYNALAVDTDSVVDDETVGPLPALRNARSILSSAQTRMRMSSVMDALRAAGVAVFSVSPAVDVGALLGPDFDSRAEMTWRFYYSDEIVDLIATIQSVEITDETTGTLFTVTE